MDLCLACGSSSLHITRHDSFKFHHLFTPKPIKFSSRRVKLIAMATSASGSCRYGSSLNTPHEPRSSPGRLLSSVLQNEKQFFHLAVSEQLEQLAVDRDGALSRINGNFISSESYLHRKIAELKEEECRDAVEDVMYMLIIYKFSEIRVPLIPRLSKCMYNGRLEIWPSKDWELESIYGSEVLDLVREHVSSITGLKVRPSVADEWATTGVSLLHLCRVYNLSIFFGYFLKAALLRHCLEANLCFSLGFDPGKVDSLGFGELVPSGFWGSVLGHGIEKVESFERYVRRFDGDMMERCARLRSKEGVDLVDKHCWALFGGDGGEVDDKMILTSFSSLKRLVLEAVAFGSFLWDAEEHVDRVYKLAVT